MKLTPAKYQNEDSDIMLEYQHAFLWGDPGTGKTLTAMEAARKGGVKKLVVLCPRIALSMWKEELETYLGGKAVILRSGRNSVDGLHDNSYLITTFDLAKKNRDVIRRFLVGIDDRRHKKASRHNFKEVLDDINKNRPPGYKRPTNALVLDEVQYLKNSDAKRTQAVFGMRCDGGDDSLFSEFDDVWQLTGTPILRHVDDLWSQLRAARADILRHYGVLSKQAFINEFCRVDYRQFGKGPKRAVIVGSKNLDRLNKLVADCKVIRRKRDDVLKELPPITHRLVDVGYANIDRVDLDPATLIRELNKPDSPTAKVRRQLGVAKAADVAQYAAEYGTMPLLIGFWHHETCDAIKSNLEALLPDAVIEVVKGGTSPNEIDRIRDGFNAGKIDVILGQMQAMNVSWNLQEACSHVIVAEELTSEQMLLQFYSRVYRKGQKQHVQVDHCRSDHGLDAALVRLRADKDHSAALAIDG